MGEYELRYLRDFCNFYRDEPFIELVGGDLLLVGEWYKVRVWHYENVYIATCHADFGDGVVLKEGMCDSRFGELVGRVSAWLLSCFKKRYGQ